MIVVLVVVVVDDCVNMAEAEVAPPPVLLF